MMGPHYGLESHPGQTCVEIFSSASPDPLVEQAQREVQTQLLALAPHWNREAQVRVLLAAAILRALRLKAAVEAAKERRAGHDSIHSPRDDKFCVWADFDAALERMKPDAN